jgi:hypothetical protein
MCVALLAALAAAGPGTASDPSGLRIVGTIVTPHVRAQSMRFRRDPGPADGALVRVIVIATESATPWSRRDIRVLGQVGRDLVQSGAWAWCDFPGDEIGAADPVRPGEMTVLTFNTRSAAVGLGSTVQVGLDGRGGSAQVELKPASAHLAAVTFFGSKSPATLDQALLHVVNAGAAPMRIREVRFRQPAERSRHWALAPAAARARIRTWPADSRVDPGDTAVIAARVRLVPTYTLVEVDLAAPDGATLTIFGYVRAKHEAFDISGGWVSGGATRDGRTPLAHPEYVRTLAGLHVNTGHFTDVAGYSDQSSADSLYARYPLKRFGILQPVERYDTDALLPSIHGVEFIGEPQYGGGRPVPPQEVWRQLHPYAPSRLPTTVTLSEEAQWRFYAGLSDYPHYDAYRVNAPAADAWRLYDRWGGLRISWGAPLETIGDMCRSLREMSRPAPTAYWSQGPHDWESYGGRRRGTPTCDELRMQAYHALASRITSLYWFNLSLRSLLLYPDTMAELRRVGREMRMLERLYLRGSAYRCRQVEEGGSAAWELSSIVAPEGAALFALDLRYAPDPAERVFVFDAPREAAFEFELPRFLRAPADVFRVDADGVHNVTSRPTATGIVITDRANRAAVYVAARDRSLRADLQRRHRALVALEKATGFDPVGSPADLEALRAVQGSAGD